MPNAFETLAEHLRQLPGVGPRQARRLAYFLMHRDKAWVRELATAMVEASKLTHTCGKCMRFFTGTETVCDICRNPARDRHTLLIVEKDVDLENIERTGAYSGLYFVLGGTTSLLDKAPEKHVRAEQLLDRLHASDGEIHEIILALSATTEGEDTVAFIRERVAPYLAAARSRITALGRGLSTGTELEYVDGDTLRSALTGRG